MSYYSLMTQLPQLPAVPDKPPLSLRTLISILQDELTQSHWELARILLLKLDVANLEMIICGTPQLFDHRALFDPEVFSGKTAHGDESLPWFMEDVLAMMPERAGLAGVIGTEGKGGNNNDGSGDSRGGGTDGSGGNNRSNSNGSAGGGAGSGAGCSVGTPQEWGGGGAGLCHLKDQLWRNYYEYVDEEATARKNLVLGAWLEYEVPLLNSLLRLRNRLNAGNEVNLVEGGSDWSGGVDVHDVTEAVIEEPLAPASHHDLLLHVVEMGNPMERERMLDEARLFAMDSIPVIDQFSADGVLVYLAKMLVLDEWDLPRVAHIEKMLEVF